MIKDTSSEYEDLVGYISEENIPKTLDEFLGDPVEYKPSVKKKQIDPEFPEQWQTLYINFESLEDYRDFMFKMGEVPVPKLNSFVYTKEKDDGILGFFGD